MRVYFVLGYWSAEIGERAIAFQCSGSIFTLSFLVSSFFEYTSPMTDT